MPRRPNIERPVRINLCLPESTKTRIDLLLYSSVEGRIPHGAYQTFFLGLVRDYFDRLKETSSVQSTDSEPDRPLAQ